MAWINSNIDCLYHDFIESGVSYRDLLFIHKWNDPDKFSKLGAKEPEPKKVREINIRKFKIALMNIVEAKANRHRSSIRTKSVEEIKYKMFQCNYTEKLNYLDFQIETKMRELSCRDDKKEYMKELSKIRRRVVKN